MAIIPTTKTTIARYAAGLYGVKLGGDTLAAVVEDVQFNTANGVNGLNTVLNSYYAPFAGMTSAQVAAIVVANAGVVEGRYGLTAANVADALMVVTAELNASAPVNNQGATIAAVLAGWSNNFTTDPVFGPAARAWNLKIAQANTYATGAGSKDVAFGEVNTEFNLAPGADKITGTEGDDTFTAVLGSLDNTDVIDGGAGNDMLKAQVNGVIAPTIKNVEHLQFQAQFRTADSGDNNLADEQIVKVDFNTNVTSVTGFNTIENNNSRADLIVEDVRIANNQITKDITVVMRETDPGNVDYGVYFDQNSLRNVSTSASQINLRVLDTYAVSQGKAPLLDSPYGSFTFSYSLNGAAAVSVTLASQGIQDAQTFPEMVAALQAAADGVFGAGTVTVALGNTYTVPDSVTKEIVQGTEIALSAKGNIVFSTPAGSGWLATDVVPAKSGLYTFYDVGGSTASELVTVNVVLDDVGRGSTGGDLVIGGMSVGETSTSKGVQKFLIEVQDNSKLQTIESTNNTLREVVIVNGVTTRVDNAYNENEKDAGSLTVRGFEAPNNGVGNNALPGSKAALANPALPGPAGFGQNPFGFSDVKIIDGSAMTGKLNFTAEVTQASIAKYLNLKDGAPAQPAADNQAFVYSGGKNNDTMEVTLDAGILGARNQLTGREDFSFSLNGGAGNDKITVEIGGVNTANWYANHKAMKNLVIDGGDGNDMIWAKGATAAKILAGAGDDVVYADNSGVVGAIWTVNQSGFNADPLAGTVPTTFLVNGKVTVSFAPGANAGGGVTGVAASGADAVAAAFTNGFEVVVDIPTGANYAVSQYHINQAIKKAINEDVVLSKLLVAEDGPASTLNIRSLIDGSFDANNLEIVVSSTLGATPAADVLAAYKAFSQNSAASNADVIAANTASVGVANTVSGVGVDKGVLAQTGGLAHAVSVVTEGSAGTGPVAGTFEVATYTPAALLAGQTVIIDGLTLTSAAGATAADVQTALTGAAPASITKTGVLNTYVAAVSGANVTFTSTIAGNVPDLTVGGTGTGTMTVTTQGVAATVGTPAATEVVTIDFSGVPVVGDVVTFTSPTGAGVPVTHTVVAGDTAATIATDFAAQITALTATVGSAWEAYATAVATGGKLTLTGDANIVIANPTAASITHTTGGASFGNGAISTVESDNTIDLGAGNDVAVLGTGVNSNDTVVFTGYNLGKNTIVNFEDATASSRDLLDFTSYLNNKTSMSGSTESQKAIAVTLNTDTVTEANSVTVLNGTFNNTTDTFAGLTADKLMAAVNSTNTGTANYAGLTAASLDALTSYTTASGANNLVGGVGKAVVLVQNNLNEGEYQVFELTFNGVAANNANADFSAAQLIGTVDFGNEVTFAQNLLVG